MTVYELKDELHHPVPRERCFGIVKSKPDGHISEPKYSYYMLNRLFGGTANGKKYDAVIFDLDGVIVSTAEQHCLAWRRLADELDISFDREVNNRLRGVARMDCMDIFLENSEKVYTAEEKKALADRKNEYYLEMIKRLSDIDIINGAVEIITFLKEHGIKVAIGSSGKNAPLILEKLGITSLFDFVSDGNNISHNKTDPEVFPNAANALRISPQRCLVVVDAVSNVEAALRGGMDVLGIGEASKDFRVTYGFDKISDICFGEDIRPYVK